eukprot:3487955-Pyramimonas_sp.AAC.1
MLSASSWGLTWASSERWRPPLLTSAVTTRLARLSGRERGVMALRKVKSCLLYTSDAADDTPCVDL